jgi:hypothetical protein
MLAGCALAIIGYIMLLAGSKSGVKYAGTFFVACGGMQDTLALWCPPDFNCRSSPANKYVEKCFRTPSW